MPTPPRKTRNHHIFSISELLCEGGRPVALVLNPSVHVEFEARSKNIHSFIHQFFDFAPSLLCACHHSTLPPAHYPIARKARQTTTNNNTETTSTMAPFPAAVWWSVSTNVSTAFLTRVRGPIEPDLALAFLPEANEEAASAMWMRFCCRWSWRSRIGCLAL